MTELSKEESDVLKMIAFNSYDDFCKYAATKILQLYADAGKEIADLKKELGEVKLERDVYKDAMSIANQAFVDREDEIEQLRNHLEKAEQAMKDINKNIMNRYVIREIVAEFLSQWRRNSNEL